MGTDGTLYNKTNSFAFLPSDGKAPVTAGWGDVLTIFVWALCSALVTGFGLLWLFFYRVQPAMKQKLAPVKID